MDLNWLLTYHFLGDGPFLFIHNPDDIYPFSEVRIKAGNPTKIGGIV